MVDIHSIFKLFLFVTLLLSFYILVSGFINSSPMKKSVFSAWQFPMLLAIFLEALIIDF